MPPSMRFPLPAGAPPRAWRAPHPRDVTDSRPRRPAARGRFLALGLGTRMLALFLALLALWAVVSLALLNNALEQRLNSRVDQELSEEISDFGRLADDRRPASGGFDRAGLERLFDTMLARNTAGDGELVLTFIEGDRKSVV